MRVMKRPGQMFAEVEVTRHIMTKNMWEYYLEEPDDILSQALTIWTN